MGNISLWHITLFYSISCYILHAQFGTILCAIEPTFRSDIAHFDIRFHILLWWLNLMHDAYEFWLLTAQHWNRVRYMQTFAPYSICTQPTWRTIWKIQLMMLVAQCLCFAKLQPFLRKATRHLCQLQLQAAVSPWTQHQQTQRADRQLHYYRHRTVLLQAKLWGIFAVFLLPTQTLIKEGQLELHTI